KSAVLGDAGIVDEHVDRADVGLDLLDAGSTGVERGDIPFVDGNAGLALELLGGGIIARITRRVLVSRRLQRLADRSPNAARTARHQCNTCHLSPPHSSFMSRNFSGLVTTPPFGSVFR